MGKIKRPKYIGQTMSQTIFEEVDDNKEKRPNVLFVVLDDVGFAQLGCFGSNIDTPNLDRLAEEGLRYNNFHTTAICSATRASLLTGANHHSVGIEAIAEAITNCPNGTGRIDPAYATIAEVLHEDGYTNYAIGKWHVLNTGEISENGPFSDYPLGKGFDRYYGFLSAQSDQYYPDLVQDNTHIRQPKLPKEGYHLSEDLTDHALNYLTTHYINTPEKPFFLYLAYGAMHAPHHAPKKYIEKYKGRFDEGWDVLREKWFVNQKKLGIIPEDALLTERNEIVPAWDSFSKDEQKVLARYMEVFAGYLDHTDSQIGRVIDYLREIGELDNTIVVFLSDNGASAEGGRYGRYHCLKATDIYSEKAELELGKQKIDDLGSEYAFNHYPIGWANLGNVPFPWYKSWTYSGGVKDPMIIRYPRAIQTPGEVRSQYQHVIDIVPTIYDLIGIEKPDHVKGVIQKPLHGQSFKQSLTDPKAEGRYIQHFEIVGNRAIYKDGWKALVNHSLNENGFADDKWELYHVENDYSEAVNVADQYPEKVQELKECFLIEAAKYGVFPMLEGSMHKPGGSAKIFSSTIDLPPVREAYTHISGNVRIPGRIISRLARGSFKVSVKLDLNEETQGTIFEVGYRFGGVSWYIKNKHLTLAFNSAGENVYYLRVSTENLNGETLLELVNECIDAEHSQIIISADGRRLYEGEMFVGTRIPFVGSGYIGDGSPAPVSGEYEGYFPFKGKIHSIVFDIAPTSITAIDALNEYFRID